MRGIIKNIRMKGCIFMGRAHEVRAASMAKTAAKKSKINAKYGKLIYMAAKSGIPDPELNQTLKKEIERAKKEQISAEVIRRAIERAKGGGSESYTQTRYEGFGPNNSLFIVACLTDNVNRTYTEVRTAFMKSYSKLGVDGSVIHQFKNQAVFSFEGLSDEEVLELLLEEECDVEDIVLDDDLVTVYAPATEYAHVKEVLEKQNENIEFIEDHISWLPTVKTKLVTEEDEKQYNRLMTMLDDIDDVQDIYHNIELNEA